MIIINRNHEIISEYDLNKGYLVPCTIIRPDAEPIDNVKKHAWSDEDYIQAKMFILKTPTDTLSHSEQIAKMQEEIDFLKAENISKQEQIDLLVSGATS